MFRILLLAAVALVLAVTGYAALSTLKPRVFRERVDGGIRLRDTKNGLGAILPGALYRYARETITGVVVRVARSIRTALAVMLLPSQKPRPVHLRNAGSVYADATTILDQLKEKLTAIQASMVSIQEAADKENREVTSEETSQIETLFEAFNKVEADIKRREQIEQVNAKMQQPTRRSSPVSPNAHALEVKDGSRITGGEPTEAMKGTGGFSKFGEFAKAVVGQVTGGRVDPRLSVFAASPTTYGNEGTGADGGYLIPPDFRTAILKKVQGEDALLGRCDQNLTSSNSINVPVDETTPWQTSGGILAYWEGEASTYPQSKPALKSVNVRAHKLTALVPVTDEQLEDGPSLEAYLRMKAPDKLNFKINDAIVNGDGQGKPLGILNSAAKVTVPKEAGQATGTILFANIVKMWSRIYDPCRRRGVWIINQDIEQQLFQLVVPGTQAAFPAYMPPGGLSQSPYGTLMGRPVVYSEAAQSLSTEGDLIFADLSQYLALTKAGGLRSDVSIHLWFDQGLTAFRFTMRLGGLPWWAAPIVRKNGTNTLSCIVTLQSR